MTLKLYWWLPSQPSRAVKSLLTAGNVEHEEQHLDIFKHEQKDPEYLAVNPMGQVPALTLNGKAYNESASMMRYLCSKYDSLKKFYPSEVEVRYEIDQLLDFNAAVLRPTVYPPLGAAVGKMIMKKDDLCPKEKEMMAEQRPKINALLDSFNARIQKKGKTFLTGNAITIADFQLYCQFLDLAYYGWDWSKWPAIQKWTDACRAAPGLKCVHDQFFEKVATPDFVKAIGYPQTA